MSGPLPTVWLNGGLRPLAGAMVPVLDRGFLFGDGIYELIPVYGGQPLRLDAHLGRLADGLAAVNIPDPGRARWEELVATLIRANGGGDIYVYLQITRGVASWRDHVPPQDIEPTVFGMCAPFPAPAPDLATAGVAAITRPDDRWANCSIKATSLLPNVLARMGAMEAGAVEAILLRDGALTEGAASTVFVVNGQVLNTTPNGSHILPGTTRDLILELAATVGIETRIGTVSERALRGADEIWLCSSTKEVVPVTRLDGDAVGDGRPGAYWERIHSAYQAYTGRVRSSA